MRFDDDSFLSDEIIHSVKYNINKSALSATQLDLVKQGDRCVYKNKDNSGIAPESYKLRVVK